MQDNHVAFILKNIMDTHAWRWAATSDANQVTLEMSAAQAKKRKVDYCVCNKTWTAKDFSTEYQRQAVYFICGTRVAVLRDYNLSRHYMTKNENEIETSSQNRSKGSRFPMESSLKECEWTLLQ